MLAEEEALKTAARASSSAAGGCVDARTLREANRLLILELEEARALLAARGDAPLGAGRGAPPAARLLAGRLPPPPSSPGTLGAPLLAGDAGGGAALGRYAPGTLRPALPASPSQAGKRAVAPARVAFGPLDSNASTASAREFEGPKP